MQNKTFVIIIILLSILFITCTKEHKENIITDNNDDLSSIPYNPTPFIPAIPSNWPALPIPANNTMNEEKIELGRMLFYDPILSRDSSIACASCHKIALSFSDNEPKSIGVNGLSKRHSMALINVAYNTVFFWDGRSSSLEEQSIHPVQDPIEMDLAWNDAEIRIRRSSFYPALFRKAFGVNKKSEITKTHITQAIATFERTLLSFNSRIDKKLRDSNFQLTDDEDEGILLFSKDNLNGQPNEFDFECWHCHGDPFFNRPMVINDFFNNGLDSVGSNLNAFIDKGLGQTTGVLNDNGTFKAVSLRNIMLTAPYMHDARFQTIDEVINHYISGGKPASNKNTNIHKIEGVTLDKRRQLKAFLNALTDTAYINNPKFKNPFH
jgi:cytochrome c peroxidase